MHASELREKTADELRTELLRLKQESYNLRFQRAQSEFRNTSRIREVRRDTARVLTVMGEKAAQPSN